MPGSEGLRGPGWDSTDPLVRHALDALVAGGGLALAVLDADGRLQRVSDAFAALADVPPAALLGRRAGEVLGPAGARLEAAAADRRPRTEQLSASGADGSQATWSVTLAPLLAEGSVAVWVWDGRSSGAEGPSTPAERTRLELLRRAGELMVSSLEPAHTLENLCRLLVPAVADHAFVDLHDGDVLRRVAIRHAPGVEVDPRLQRPLGVPAGYSEGHPVLRAFERGEVLLVADFRGSPEAVPGGPDTEFLRAMGATSVLIVPLRTGARILGSVVLLCSVSGRHYGEADVALVQEVVDHAAQAVTNSLRYDQQRSAAVELQRALLPAALPTVEGVDVAWRYVPGTDGTEVGGDWADVVELPGGRVALVVGDVMGRGLQAAAVMGQVRTAMRALAMQDPPPADLLTQLDGIVGGLGDDQIVTCVYGVYDPARGTVTLANAGHLPPLLQLEGRCQPLSGLTAVPLGVGGVEFSERVVPMPRGALLALYTDGLIERRQGDLDDAVDDLCDALLESRGSLADRCGSVLQRSAPAGPAGFHDDVALLLVRAQLDPTEVAVQHLLTAVPSSVGEARRLAAATLDSWGLDDEELHLTGGLLVSELVTNAVRYAQGDQVELLLRRGRSAVWVEVGDRDTRSPRRRHASLDDEGGRGLALVQALSAAWGTRTLRDGKVVWIRLDLPAGAKVRAPQRQPA